MSAIQFRFGLSLNGHPVNIKDAVKEESYTCVNCGKPLIAKQGAVREWHFAHKTNTSNCSFETYLHKLSKYFIREMFNEKQQLLAIREKLTQICDREHVCPFKKDKNCFVIEEDHVDLLRYNDCVEEASIKGFVADLLFTSDALDPILIEICVTHPCTEDKIKSGLKIIEIQVESEEDVEKLLEGKFIESKNVVFYNFPDDSTLSENCQGHNVFHGFACRQEHPWNQEFFDERRESCKDAFWPNPDYSWELYAEEKTENEYLQWYITRWYLNCSSCYWCSVKNQGKGLCCLKHIFVFTTEKACPNHLLDVKLPSVCHRNGESYIFHLPKDPRPQRLKNNNPQ